MPLKKTLTNIWQKNPGGNSGSSETGSTIRVIDTKKMKSALFLMAFITVISSPVLGADSNDPGISFDDSTYYFAKIYVDGANADSNGFKLLLRASERHAGVHFQPYIVDVDFILKDGEKTIYSKKVRQVPVGEAAGGTTEIFQPWHVALEEGKNYTAIAEIYLYENGKVSYLRRMSANFTAITDASITDIYGDSIGASATVKSESMVPLNAKVVFTLKQNGRVLEVQETRAPYLMSNDREKTVDVLWNKRLQPGEYIISSELRGKEVIARYDKAITVEKPKTSVPTAPPTPSSTPAIPGFPAYIALTALILVILVRRNKK